MPHKEGINRQVFYANAPQFNPTAEYPKNNNRHIYFRAPEGYLFLLVDIRCSTSGEDLNGIIELSDGNYYTGWNIFPGVENRETLDRFVLSGYEHYHYSPLNMWEAKEITISARSVSETYAFKCCVIIYYYLKKATREELLEYAIKHPLNQDTFKRILRGTTVEPLED